MADRKRRMGFPFKGGFFCVCLSDSPAGCRASRDTETAFHAPARLFVFGWGCAALTEKAGRLPGLV